MSDFYTHEDVKRAVEAGHAIYESGTPVGYWDEITAVLDAVAPAIAARALREAADDIIAGRTLLIRARADEIEATS